MMIKLNDRGPLGNSEPPQGLRQCVPATQSAPSLRPGDLCRGGLGEFFQVEVHHRGRVQSHDCLDFLPGDRGEQSGQVLAAARITALDVRKIRTPYHVAYTQRVAQLDLVFGEKAGDETLPMPLLDWRQLAPIRFERTRLALRAPPHVDFPEHRRN